MIRAVTNRECWPRVARVLAKLNGGQSAWPLRDGKHQVGLVSGPDSTAHSRFTREVRRTISLSTQSPPTESAQSPHCLL
jgi:hypothetical protein